MGILGVVGVGWVGIELVGVEAGVKRNVISEILRIQVINFANLAKQFFINMPMIPFKFSDKSFDTITHII